MNGELDAIVDLARDKAFEAAHQGDPVLARKWIELVVAARSIPPLQQSSQSAAAMRTPMGLRYWNPLSQSAQ